MHKGASIPGDFLDCFSYPFSVTVNGLTNQMTGTTYDSNGNQGNASQYDVENRLAFYNDSSGKPIHYGYDGGNKRVSKHSIAIDANGNPSGTETLMFYGVGGERLAEFTMTIPSAGGGSYYLRLTESKTLVWFGSKLLRDGKYAVVQDRLGSVRWRYDIVAGTSSTADYYPYGQEKPSATTDDREKFATYLRDSESGLDYADQRYHNPGWGRFLSPDPYHASAGAGQPGSWNRYAYVEGDPVNANDPRGLFSCWFDGTNTTGSDSVNVVNCAYDYGEPGREIVIFFPGIQWPNKQDQELMIVEAQEALAGQDQPGGLRNVREGLRDISKMDLSKCAGLLEDMTGHSISDIQKQARMSAGFVIDGTTAKGRLWTVDEFVDSRAAGWTVQDGVNWMMLAAIGIQESKAGRMMTQNGGKGRGYFQIDLGKNPQVTEEQAMDFDFALDFTAKSLAANADYISSAIPDLPSDVLYWMQGASHNTGLQGQIDRYNAGNSPDWKTSPDGKGSYKGNYGATILGLASCFK